MIYFFGKYILGPFILLFWRPRVFGGKHLNVKGPAIFIANHLSMADPLLIALLSPGWSISWPRRKSSRTRLVGGFSVLCLRSPLTGKPRIWLPCAMLWRCCGRGRCLGSFRRASARLPMIWMNWNMGPRFWPCEAGRPGTHLYPPQQLSQLPAQGVYWGTPKSGGDCGRGFQT